METDSNVEFSKGTIKENILMYVDTREKVSNIISLTP